MNAKLSSKSAVATKSKSLKKKPVSKRRTIAVVSDEPTPVITPPTAKPKNAPPTPPKKLGCLDAAAQVLAAANGPLTCKELIAAMAEQKLWSSPAGQTPHATLYSAILREMSAKGTGARFVKAERGKFVAPSAAVAAT